MYYQVHLYKAYIMLNAKLYAMISGRGDGRHWRRQLAPPPSRRSTLAMMLNGILRFFFGITCTYHDNTYRCDYSYQNLAQDTPRGSLKASWPVVGYISV